MEVQLTVLAGAKAGQVIRITGAKFFIGRSEDCHLRPLSDLISRHHCVIVTDGNYAGVRDFNSRNGTFVNGERVQVERQLFNGDRLKVGPLEFEVALVDQPAKKRPKVTSVKEAAARTAQGTSDSSSALDEPDLTDWLTGDQNAAASGETRAVSRQELTTRETVEATLDDLVQQEAPPTPTPADPKQPPRKPGKLPPPPPMGNSSEDAAAQVLRKLRRLR
jgi:pSer/pThr/pTyr-binding forkhead associated (FHA) protein